MIQKINYWQDDEKGEMANLEHTGGWLEGDLAVALMIINYKMVTETFEKAEDGIEFLNRVHKATKRAIADKKFEALFTEVHDADEDLE